MMKDEIVEQVCRAREAQAVKQNFDLKAILAGARKRQKLSCHRVVSFTIKPKTSD